jgi:prophage antirepressor-like protein
MSHLKTNAIRVVELDGEPWFVAADVCNVLGHTNPTVAIRILGEAEKTKSDLGSGRPLNVVSESGLYKLIMRSDKPEAKAFQDWVTKVVLPAIRKDGDYILGEEKVRRDTPVETATSKTY